MISDKHKPQLIQSARQIINQVCVRQMGAMIRAPTGEIDFIASLIENGAGALETAWQTILSPSKINVRVAGVFCHQSPMVDIKTFPKISRPVPTTRCELADLLILNSYSRADKRVFWRGVLVQTKLQTKQQHRPDEPQFWLYEDWPKFSITSPGFDVRTRDFNQDQRSGLYALVSNAGWVMLPASNPLTASNYCSEDLGEFLVNMLYDMEPAQPGRTSEHGRQVYWNSQNDWSLTVWELLEVTGLKSLRHKGKKSGLYVDDRSRVGGGALQLAQYLRSSQSAAPPTGTGFSTKRREEPNLSILIIETSSELEQ